MSLSEFLLRNLVYYAAFYILYELFLKGNTFFQLNRVYLLAAALVSTLLPLLHYHSNLLLPVVQLPEAVLAGMDGMPKNTAAADTGVTVYGIIRGTYFGGVIVSLLILSQRLVALLLFARTKCTRRDGIYLLPESSSQPAFSFMGMLFVHPSLDAGGRSIAIAHEQVHVRQWHSADIVVYELFCALFWFNPLYRLARKQLAITHEFIADQQACGNNPVQYSSALVAQMFGAPSHALVHSFNKPGTLKQRLIMLTKEQNRPMARLRYLVAIPALAFLMILNGLSFASPGNQEKVYTTAEKVPEFKGNMMEYLGKNIKYPEEAKRKNLEGKIYVGFIVNSKGRVTDVKIVKGVNPLLDNEALRVIRSMPDWKPAEDKGKAVSMQMNLPIRFTMGATGK